MPAKNCCMLCGVRVPTLHRRCVRCRKAHAKKISAGQLGRTDRYEPTEAELDELIARQQAELPDW